MSLNGVESNTDVTKLLAPANAALTDPCLAGPITEYDWAEGIALMTIFVMFFLELMIMRYSAFGSGDDGHSHGHSHNHGHGSSGEEESDIEDPLQQKNLQSQPAVDSEAARPSNHIPGKDHHGHAREHTHNEEVSPNWQQNRKAIIPEAYAAQLTAMFILEVTIIFRLQCQHIH